VIANPNRVVLDDALRQEAIEDGDKDATPLRGAVRVKAFTFDPDREVDAMVRTVSSAYTEVDAVLMERASRTSPYRQVHYPTFAAFMESRQVRKRILDHMEGRDIRDLNARLREAVAHDGRKGVQRALQRHLRETGPGSSNYDLGLYQDEVSTGGYGQRSVFPIQDTVLPSLNSPHAKQQLFMDYLDHHRKCLAFDTQVALLDGTNVSIGELAARGPEAEFWVYACKDGMVVPALARSARQTGVMQTYDVVLDNGETVRATANHPFMRFDGTYTRLDELKPGDRLMPLYRRLSRSNPKGYEEVLHPHLRLWEPTHRLVPRVTQPDLYLSSNTWQHVDHINEDAADNRPENLQLMTRQQHMVKTAAHPDRRAFATTLGRRKRTPEERARMSAIQKATWANPEVRAKRLNGLQAAWSDPETHVRMRAGLKSAPNHRNNHTVVSVQPAGVEPVFDTTVPRFGNFGLTAGVFVHNSWEAATRNPIGKRICDLIPQFVLGRGLVCTIDNAEHQHAWDQHWQRNRMRWRMRQILKELLIYGEVFLRYFDTKDGLLVRSLDPSTIWDIITDPDDIESVDFYHQQYTLLNMSPVPGYVSRIPSQLIIRQIPGPQIDHFKINCTSSEKRGRSQLYTILGWLLRFKEFCNDRVLQNKMRAMFSLDVTVKSGDPSDMMTVEELFNRPPAPGSVLIHNDAVELEFKNANVNANDSKTDADMLLKVIALGSGVSEAFLGVSAASTRAGALIQTEPDVKNFETYQEIVEDILGASYERIRVKAKLPSTKSRFEVTFPALAQEDRSAKLKDIAMAESMDYFSKARAASMAAKEFSVTGYNFEIERQQILEERATSPMMAKGMEQMPKITQDPMMGGGLTDETPGPKPNPQNDDTKGVTQTSGQMGFSAKNLSGRGMANTQATLDRGSFTRGGEKSSIQTSASAGAPLRASAEGAPKPRNVWSEKARAAALATRRANRARRESMKEE
jgi:hypothetical protein